MISSVTPDGDIVTEVFAAVMPRPHLVADVPAPASAQIEVVLGALSGVSPCLVIVYLLARQLVPVLLIVYALCGAPAKERVALVRDYLLSVTQRRTDQ